jgi:hypothetical protein
MSLDDRIDQACAAVGAGQKTEQCHVERIDLLSEGRRAKMLRVWAVFIEKDRNIHNTAKAFGCSRNTVKSYIRLYQQELNA